MQTVIARGKKSTIFSVKENIYPIYFYAYVDRKHQDEIFLNRKRHSGKDVRKRKGCGFVLKIHTFPAEFRNKDLSAVLTQLERLR